MKKWIKYYRVSTHKQGYEGLGISAQKNACETYVNSNGGITIAEFTEVESGGRNDRPQLMAALELARKEKACLLVARLDRLSRDSVFLITLKKSEVEFVCVDMPTLDNFTVSLYAILAEREKALCSQRTRAALAAAKQRGIKLGNPRFEESLVRAHEAASRAKEEYRKAIKPLIKEIQDAGVRTLSGIAHCLNVRGIKTRTGKGIFYPATVRLVLAG